LRRDIPMSYRYSIRPYLQNYGFSAISVVGETEDGRLEIIPDFLEFHDNNGVRIRIPGHDTRYNIFYRRGLKRLFEGLTVL